MDCVVFRAIYSVAVQAKAPLPLTMGRQHEAKVVRQYVKEEAILQEDGCQKGQGTCHSIGCETDPHPPNRRGSRIRVMLYGTRLQHDCETSNVRIFCMRL